MLKNNENEMVIELKLVNSFEAREAEHRMLNAPRIMRKLVMFDDRTYVVEKYYDDIHRGKTTIKVNYLDPKEKVNISIIKYGCFEDNRETVLKREDIAEWIKENNNPVKTFYRNSNGLKAVSRKKGRKINTKFVAREMLHLLERQWVNDGSEV